MTSIQNVMFCPR